MCFVNELNKRIEIEIETAGPFCNLEKIENEIDKHGRKIKRKPHTSRETSLVPSTNFSNLVKKTPERGQQS